MSHLDDGVSARLSPCSRADPEYGVRDWDAVLGAESVEQSHGDTEEGHADRSAASATSQPPHQANSVHRRPVNLRMA